MSRLITRSGGGRITGSSRVTLHFSLHLESGEEVDTTRRARPATFTMGDGSLLPGFERALLGLAAGDDVQVLLEPEDAFGERRPENVRTLSTTAFAGMDLEPGLVVSFAAPEGELPGVVQAVVDGTVRVDFNHPLAGRRIVFDVSVLAVADGDPGAAHR